MLARFLPQTVPFFKLLMEQNAVLQRMAQSLIVVMENTYESEGHLKQINILEEEADKLNRKITWHLSQTFITPIDREDIHAINLAQGTGGGRYTKPRQPFFYVRLHVPAFPGPYDDPEHQGHD